MGLLRNRWTQEIARAVAIPSPSGLVLWGPQYLGRAASALFVGIPVAERRQQWTRLLLSGLVGVVLAYTPPAAAQGVEETQTNRDGPVTVAVTWPGPTAGLVFKVVLDTHSVDLDRYDLAVLALVRGDQESEVPPISWDAPLGGHHREGSLVFPDAQSDGTPVIGPDARSLELVVRDVGGIRERVFKWTWE